MPGAGLAGWMGGGSSACVTVTFSSVGSGAGVPLGIGLSSAAGVVRAWGWVFSSLAGGCGGVAVCFC